MYCVPQEELPVIHNNRQHFMEVLATTRIRSIKKPRLFQRVGKAGW